jgi:hypothetical protein
MFEKATLKSIRLLWQELEARNYRRLRKSKLCYDTQDNTLKNSG